MKHKTEGLNLIPLIDVMLVLLAIILCISSFVDKGSLDIQVPKAQSKPIQKTPHSVKVSIDRSNQYWLNQKKMSLEELRQSLNALSNETLIELEGDLQSKYQSFVAILEILTQKQHENFSIITQNI